MSGDVERREFDRLESLLERVDRKLDGMAETLIRQEERMVSQERTLAAYKEAHDSHEARIRQLELRVEGAEKANAAHEIHEQRAARREAALGAAGGGATFGLLELLARAGIW